jgi:hypothetical protein
MFANQLDARRRICAIAYNVAETVSSIDPACLDLFEHRLESLQIRMNVGYYSKTHRPEERTNKRSGFDQRTNTYQTPAVPVPHARRSTAASMEPKLVCCWGVDWTRHETL